MFRQLNKTLQLSFITDMKIKKSDNEKLEEIKEAMMNEMDTPIGWHTMGIPLIISAILTVVSFSLPQISIWHGISKWMDWSKNAFFIGAMITDLVGCIIIIPLMAVVGKGQYLALKSYVYIAFSTATLAISFLIYTILGTLLGADIKTTHLIVSIIGVILIILSFMCINSLVFYRMIAYCLHNRAWRKQIEMQREKPHL
ncbi:hypothetical protein QMA77_22520 [Pantoea ananatis]|uniref:hypothetical protein n=1 Tax=Pantoea TaxID=53335 RepID=UPI000D5CF0FB|nr:MULTISPECIES: hypothetical protein [Pantoea]MCS4494557.1 hypothetical protein [Pantoea sp. B623]MDI6539694.1 hypothetical protein [Pantoea ananatis]MDN4134187.1 hypothetical protein [Pantoea ananatis]PVY84620.1 hypothetical protein C7427_104248 [Pantoea ananatis]REF07505.1 hypothetical protein C7428_2922 [Pantoea ananatis]